jgi:signal transduction histidine kinase
VDGVALDRDSLDRDPLDRDPLDRGGVDGITMVVDELGRQPVDLDALDLDALDRRSVAVAGLGMSPAAARVREPSRLQRRVTGLIGAQLAGACALALLAVIRGSAFGDPWAVGILALVFALTGFFGMTLEFHRYRFTFTPAEAVLAVGFFFVGPIGLAVAAAVGECVNMLVQRHAPLKAAFNVSNRLAATTAAGVAFAVLGRTDVHEAAAWGAALGAALCFSILDVVSTSAVLSIVEETRFHDVFVRSASTGLLATLTAAPVGLVALDLAEHGPFVPLLLIPITVAVALNARYAVAQRDEHLRFERLYESSARTASLVALDDSLRVLAAETRALGTGMAALCCATDSAGEWRGAFSDDDGERLASPAKVAQAVALAERVAGQEVDAVDAPEVGRIAPTSKRAVVVSSEHERVGRVVLIVLRDGAGNAGARSRVETLAAFAHNAALIVSNALLHEEREVALARQVDLNRQKSDFVAAVSHELRTPLAVMLGSVHTLERLDGRMTDEQRSQLFDMAVDQGGRLQRLIDELLLVAAAEHAEVQLQWERIEIDELIGSIVSATAGSTAGRLVTRNATACDGAAPEGQQSTSIVCDPSKVERILINLVENAAKYAPNTPIELRADFIETDVRLSVVDHGPGIPERDCERVFEQFVQLDQSSTRRQGGTGLGLHLCRQLAELVDGHLALEETPGGGCTFSLTIPAAGAAGALAVDVADRGFDREAAVDVQPSPFGNALSRPAELTPPRKQPVP